MAAVVDGASSDAKLMHVGQDVFLRRPNTGTASKGADPTVILIFGWMGAQLPHLYKYTKVYEEMYPDTTQILVRARPQYFWSSDRANQRRLEPAFEVLSAIGCLNTPGQPTVKGGITTPQLLIHSFSNGGALNMLTLGELLAARQATTPITPSGPMPFKSALVIDSAPGHATIQGAINAFTAQLSSWFTKTPAIFFIVIFSLLDIIRNKLLGRKDVMERMRDALQVPGVLPWITKDTPRLYLYSTKDKLIPYQDVEEHADEAKALGFTVRTERFETTPHVAHARAEPVRYWTAIQNVWNSATQA